MKMLKKVIVFVLLMMLSFAQSYQAFAGVGGVLSSLKRYKEYKTLEFKNMRDVPISIAIYVNTAPEGSEEPNWEYLETRWIESKGATYYDIGGDEDCRIYGFKDVDKDNNLINICVFYSMKIV